MTEQTKPPKAPQERADKTREATKAEADRNRNVRGAK